MDKLEIALQQEMQLRAGIIKQPLEGLLYDLDLMPEQCKSDVANMRRVAVEVLRREIERLKKENSDLILANKARGAFARAQCSVMKRMGKEKEWLIHKIQRISKMLVGQDEDYVRQELLKEMQRALKEG